MNKLWLLFLLVIPYQSIHAQEVKHAPTVSQCQADQRLWLSQIEYAPRLSEPYSTVSQWINEMQDCIQVDPENALLYEHTISEATATLEYREEQFLKRRGLWQRFLDEDKAEKQ